MNWVRSLKLEIEENIDSQLFSQVLHPHLLNDVGQIVHIVSSVGQALFPSAGIVAQIQIFHGLYLALEKRKERSFNVIKSKRHRV